MLDLSRNNSFTGEDNSPMVVIRLSFPPGTNNLYANGRRGRFPTARYKAWLELAAQALLRQQPEPIVGHFRAEFIYDRPDQRRRDLDGLLKAPLDALVKHQVIVDDSLARDIRARWSPMPARKPGGVLIFLEAVQ